MIGSENNMSNDSNSRGTGCGTVLFLIFLVLKLTGNVDWSWWWVTSPLWWPIPFILFVIIIAAFVHLLFD